MKTAVQLAAIVATLLSLGRAAWSPRIWPEYYYYRPLDVPAGYYGLPAASPPPRPMDAAMPDYSPYICPSKARQLDRKLLEIHEALRYYFALRARASSSDALDVQHALGILRPIAEAVNGKVVIVHNGNQ
jgi:hypothetical protein